MSNPTDRRPSSVVFGCAGARLLAEEAAFFAETRPFGFILFARNCENPAQVAQLTTDLRASIGSANAPVLIDEEGGRVQRLKPPHWRDAPAAARFGALAGGDPDRAEAACRLNARLIAEELNHIGVNVDCLPCLDLFHAPGSPAIGSRAFSADPDVVSRLGRAQVEGLMEGGILPVMKHLPGHGRAAVDSHHELPVIDADLATLRQTDFRPFQALAHLPMAMTAHIVVTAVDPERPATQSSIVIREIIRGEIGFSGILFSDDIGMQALSGAFAERTEKALEAGCDVVLHCSGVMDEMRDVAQCVQPMTDQACATWLAAHQSMAEQVGKNRPLDWQESGRELAAHLGESSPE